LRALFDEDVPTRAGAQNAAGVCKAPFVANLPAIRDLSELKEWCRRPVRVEHFGAVELAIAVDCGEDPIVAYLLFCGNVEIPHLAIEAELVISEHSCARREAAQVCIDKRIGRASSRSRKGWEGTGDKRCSAVALLVIRADHIEREISIGREADRRSDAKLVLSVEFFFLRRVEIFNVPVAGAPLECDPASKHVVATVNIPAKQCLIEVAVASA